jgi:tetratricopeptide (TPR) repeat protein
VAVLLNRHGFFKEAEEAYKAYVERDRKQPERELALATFLAVRRDENRTADAIAILTRAWKTCPPEQVAMAALSIFDAAQSTPTQKKQVEVWLTEASQKRPELVLLSNKLAAVWIRQGRYDEAEAVYRRIVKSNPENAEGLNNLAWLLALRDQNNTQEALGFINRAIDYQGRVPSLIDTRAVVYIRSAGKENIDEAIKELEEAQRLDERNPNLPLHLAWARHAEGRNDKAKQAFNEALRLGWNPERSDPLERDFIDKLRQALGL